jgi:hypothetical protein
MPYEKKGILFSEMFFLYISSLSVQPLRVIESGRARGQSTLILSKLFMNAEIISIEHDASSPDTLIAKKRLSKARNVKMLFGDSSLLLPQILSKGTNDIVLIDGPKGYKAIRLALRILSFKNVKQVYIHDTHILTHERAFLDKHLTDIIYSDDPKLAKENHGLDQNKKIALDDESKFKPGKQYGFSLACIDNTIPKDRNLLITYSRLIQFVERIGPKLRNWF